jgi:hypothetical protein
LLPGQRDQQEFGLQVQGFSTAEAVNALAHQVTRHQRETALAVPHWDEHGKLLGRFPVYTADGDPLPWRR